MCILGIIVLVHLVACDGIEALRMISKKNKTPKSGNNSYDMIGSARQYLKKSLIKWSFRHVKEHKKVTK
jgi:hypothetical protein